MWNELSHLTPALWLATYLLHSTLLLAAAWLVTIPMRRRGPATPAEAIWKIALVAPIISATLQVGLCIDPMVGRVLVNPPVLVSHDVAAAVEPANSPDEAEAPVPVAAETASAEGRPGEMRREDVPSGSAAAADPQASEEARRRFDQAAVSGDEMTRQSGSFDHAHRIRRGRASGELRQLVLPAIGIAMAIPGAFWIAGWLRLAVLMHGRRRIVGGPLFGTLESLRDRCGLRRRVTLSVAEHITAPIAFGIMRPEICLPQRVLSDLGTAQQEAVLAHELAHLVRRDPLWLGLVHLVEGLFFFQPLNRFAGRQLRELAELHCDAWAARRTGDRLTLAQSLTEVAGWIVGRSGSTALIHAPGMAGARSSLGRRVRRLLDDAPLPTRAATARWLMILACAALPVMTLLAPGVGAQVDGERGGPAGAEITDPRDGAPVENAADGPALLRRELAALGEEIAAVRRVVGDSNLAGEFAGEIDEIQRRVQELRGRHRRLAELVFEVLHESEVEPESSADGVVAGADEVEQE